MRTARDRVVAEYEQILREKARKVSAQIKRIASDKKRVTDIRANLIEQRGGEDTERLGKALAFYGTVSKIEATPNRVGAGTSYHTRKEATKGLLSSVMGNHLVKVSKGALGYQKGKAHLPNVVKELFGEDSGDVVAKELAEGFDKTKKVAVNMYRKSGGAILERADYHLPQAQSASKMNRAGAADWKALHMDLLDWNETRWPDGTLILEADRDRFLQAVFETKTSYGVSKIDVNSNMPKNRRSSLADQTEAHRVLVFKDADSWLKMHEAYGDGHVLDVMARYIDNMAHKIALLDTFGPDPTASFFHLSALIEKRAQEIGPKALSGAQAVLNNKFRPLFEIVSGQREVGPKNRLGNTTVGLSNVITSAVLGRATLLAIPTDIATTLWTRGMSKMNLFSPIKQYISGMINSEHARSIALRTGFLHDDMLAATVGLGRYGTMLDHVPGKTKILPEFTIRASFMNRHTTIARDANNKEIMSTLAQFVDEGRSFDAVPFRKTMERYGISGKDWDAVSKAIKIYRPERSRPVLPRDDFGFFVPLDILKTNLKNSKELYEKFYRLIFEEGAIMVPKGSMEAQLALKGGMSPDTIAGTILHSASLFKNFPMALILKHGRYALLAETKLGRAMAIASLFGSLTMAGAISVQLREISKGRNPLPMDSLAFFGKALMAGGALSVYGDFLFSGINEYGRGPTTMVAGPLVGLVEDTADLAFGDAFKFMEVVGGISDKELKTDSWQRAVRYVKRYTPASSLWYSHLALHRLVFDSLEQLANPRAHRSWQRKMRHRQKEYGQGYWWELGEKTPAGLPTYATKR